MQVFKTYFLILRKNISSIFLYFTIFIVLALVLDRNGENTQTFNTTQSDIGILDYDKTPVSEALTKFLSEKHHVVEVPEDEIGIQNSLYNLEAAYILTIPKGFGDAFAEGKAEEMLVYYDSKDSYDDAFLNIQINQFLSLGATYCASGYPVEEAISLGTRTMEHEAEITIHRSESSNNNVFYYFNYIPYVLLCILITTMGPVLMRFYDRETIARTRCSSMPPTRHTLWLTIATTLFGLLCFAVFLGIGMILYPKELFTTCGLLYAANMFVYLLVCLAITLIISKLAKSVNILTMLSNVLGLGMSFFCGIFVPMNLLPDGLLKFSQFLPAYWYVRAIQVLENYMGEAAQLKEFLTYLGIQFCFVAALFAAALATRKNALEA